MNISDETLSQIADTYGRHSSWAVWAEVGNTPKSNVSDLSIFDPNKHPEAREALHNKIVAVGLNVSEAPRDQLFANFHSDNSKANDFKLRHAFKDTPAWGCYLTDVLKDYKQVDSSIVMREIRANHGIADKHFKSFREEIGVLGAHEATFLGLGGAAVELLRQALPKARVIQIRHYADRRKNKEAYREELLAKMAEHGLL